LCMAPSFAVEKTLQRLGVEPAKIARVKRGVDRQLFHPCRRDRLALAKWGIADEPVALYVGRLSAEKGLGVLAQAWTQIRTQMPDAKLLVVGEGPRADLVQGDHIVHTGPLYGQELATVFASTDVFAFPSETETFGNVVVEAAASGLPAVVVNAGATPEHVTAGVTGEIVAANDPAAFASALMGVFLNGEKRLAMSTAARELSVRYDFDQAVHATWSLYQSAMSTRKAA
jgi:glycosyltransferase involved in cell wall biosynthesis